MARKRKAPGADKDFQPGKAEEPRKDPPDAAEAPAPPRSEDFGRRRDIETADEPAQEHDRRHHDDEDAEVGSPA
jgi:hypothetical protein